MDKLNLKNVLTAVRDMIMRNRVAYKDYLGSETVTKTNIIVEGILVEEGTLTLKDSSVTSFVIGESYDVTIDGVTEVMIAYDLSENSTGYGAPATNYNIIALGNVTDLSNLPSDGWVVAIVNGTAECKTLGSYIGKSISISQTKTITEKHYDIKKLPDELLPSTVAKKTDLTAANREIKNTFYEALSYKVDAVPGKGLSANDYTDFEKVKLSGIEPGANKTTVDDALSSTSTNSVQNKIVNSYISAINGNINTINSNIKTINNSLSYKVDAVPGKGLSANDYTDFEKVKLSGIEPGANKTTVDDALSSTSTNPVQNMVITSNMSSKMNKSNPEGTGSFSLNRKENTDIGDRSHAEGSSATASGNYSHAEGSFTTASGNGSHAEGSFTTASGSNSHAEGISTTASGSNSHAEGYGSYTPSNITSDSTIEDIISAWKENSFLMARGDGSHAEGHNTLALNDCSHAEGANTTASGFYSHAEGISATASGNSSHAEGANATASGDSSHAEGANATASGFYSHAEGISATASGNSSHAEGSFTTASGDSSHAEGANATASGNYSHAEGCGSYTPSNITSDSTIEDIISAWKENSFLMARGRFSHAEGRNTLALNDCSHAEGSSATASGFYSHAEGSFTTASGNGSHAEGSFTTASGDRSHAEGGFTKASSQYQHVQGKYNIEDTANIYADIVGNGTEYKRSNAHTLDWSGNAWFAGTVEGTALIVPSSTEGSTKKFKITVDDSGTPSVINTGDSVEVWSGATHSAYAAAQAGGYTDTQANFYADLAAMQGLAAALAAI